MIELTDIKEAVAAILETIPGVGAVNPYGYFPITHAVNVCVMMPPFKMQSNYGYVQPGMTEPDWQSHRFFVEFWVKDTGDPVVVDQTITALNTAAVTILLQNRTITVGDGYVRLGFFDGSRFDYTLDFEVDTTITPPMQDAPAYLIATMTIPVTTV